MAYLFDSSAIYATAKAGKTQLLIQNDTCSLALYELGNILLTERRLKKIIGESEQKYLLAVISRTLDFMRIRSIRGNEQQIMIVAIIYDLSFYDASYVYLAKILGEVLVTEDNKLAKKIKAYIKVVSAAELLK